VLLLSSLEFPTPRITVAQVLPRTPYRVLGLFGSSVPLARGF
jgi:hypothetical protein